MRIAVEFRIGRRELGRHFRPVGVEFFRQNQRQGSQYALAHFSGRADDGDRMVGSDADKGVELRRLRRAKRHRAAAEAAEREGEGQSRGAGYEASPADAGIERSVLDANGHGSSLPSGALNGAHNARIGAASTDVAVHVSDDLLARRLLVGGEQCRRLHDLAGLAVPASRHLLRNPGLLPRMLAVQALDSGDLLARRFPDSDPAGAYRFVIDMDGAGAAFAGGAAEFRAGELQVLAPDPKQWGVG